MKNTLQTAIAAQRQLRNQAWKSWVQRQVQGTRGALFRFAKQEPAPPIAAIYQGNEWTIHPDAVAAEFALQWSKLWRFSAGSPPCAPLSNKDPSGMAAPAPLPELSAEQVGATLAHMSISKAAGPDGWTAAELKALPLPLLELLVFFFKFF